MYLGLDVGTTATKAILIDDRQRVIGRDGGSLSDEPPCTGQAEQDPALWLRAVETVLGALRQQAPPRSPP